MKPTLETYAQYKGLVGVIPAALIPGAKFILNIIHEEIEKLERDYRAAQQVHDNAREYVSAERGEAKAPALKVKKQNKRRNNKLAAYWASMTVEERSAEMKRRRHLGQRRQKPASKKVKREESIDLKRLHPRDPRSPRHKAWLKKLSDAQKKRFAAPAAETAVGAAA